jgi:hypothetical protein
VDDIEVYRVANTLMKSYGDEAGLVAIRRVGALSEQGDVEGAAVWLRVVDAIRELRSTTPEGRTH